MWCLFIYTNLFQNALNKVTKFCQHLHFTCKCILYSHGFIGRLCITKNQIQFIRSSRGGSWSLLSIHTHSHLHLLLGTRKSRGRNFAYELVSNLYMVFTQIAIFHTFWHVKDICIYHVFPHDSSTNDLILNVNFCMWFIYLHAIIWILHFYMMH